MQSYALAVLHSTLKQVFFKDHIFLASIYYQTCSVQVLLAVNVVFLAESDHGKFESLKHKKKRKVTLELTNVVENPCSASSGTLSANGEFESSFENLRK